MYIHIGRAIFMILAFSSLCCSPGGRAIFRHQPWRARHFQKSNLLRCGVAPDPLPAFCQRQSSLMPAWVVRHAVA